MLRNYTHNSLHKSFITPKKLVKATKKMGLDFVGICDENTISGMVEFYKECKDKEIKPVIGCEFSVGDERFPLFALNRDGLNSLISACSKIGLGETLSQEDIDILKSSDDIVEYHDCQTARYLEGDYDEFKLIVDSNKDIDKDEKTEIKENANALKNYVDEEAINKVRAEIVDRVEDYGLASRPVLPFFSCPNNMDQDEYLRHLCREGWRDKLIGSGKIDTEEAKKEYADRVKYELEVLQGAGLSGYFLVVHDIVNYVREQGWIPGPGRGSAAGCLVSYLVGITSTDPISHGLLFGRFYNKSRNTETRVELPDIDLDIPSENREQVLDYIKEKYGNSNVCHIGTFGTLQGRSALETVFKARTNMTFTEVKEMTKMLPEKARVEDLMEESEEDSLILWTLKHRPEILNKWCRVSIDDETNELRYLGDYGDLFEIAVEIEGIYRSYGKHAAGVIISPSAIKDIMPVRIDKDGDIVSTLTMKEVEFMGGVKFDILGVDILGKVLSIINKSKLIPGIEVLKDFDDEEVWDLISSGKTKGIFQLDSNTGQTWSAKVKPRNIDELSDLCSIIRPGTLNAKMDGKSMATHYVDRKFGEEFEFIHKALEPILKDTYGIIVYQEQSMKIARDIAGFSEEMADQLRKAIGKKDAKLMKELKSEFLDGCKEQGIIDDDTALIVYENIEKSNRYSFNKSHGVVYAVNAYWSAYCKVHDINYFFEVYLNRAYKKPKWKIEIKDLVMDCRQFNVDVRPPNLSRLYEEFFYNEGDNVIYYGLSKIKNVGSSETQRFFDAVKEVELQLDRGIDKFDWTEVLLLVLSRVNKKMAEALIQSGSINSKEINIDRNEMMYEYETLRNLLKKEIDWMRENYV